MTYFSASRAMRPATHKPPGRSRRHGVVLAAARRDRDELAPARFVGRRRGEAGGTGRGVAHGYRMQPFIAAPNLRKYFRK